MRYHARPMGISAPQKKWAIRAFIVFVIFYAAYASFIVWAMRQPPETFARVMSHTPGPAVFLTLPFETLWTRERAGDSPSRRPRSRLLSSEARQNRPRATLRAYRAHAGRPGLRQLHLTAFPAGGSRPQQAV